MLLLWFSMIVAKCPCLQRIPSVAPEKQDSFDVYSMKDEGECQTARISWDLVSTSRPIAWPVDLARLVELRETAAIKDLKRRLGANRTSHALDG
jgi:hypothetical protein